MSEIRQKDRDHIVQALRSGVVPTNGLHHFQVGRAKEIDALLKDIKSIGEGGSSFRLVIGDYGSGKTFFLSLMRTIAHRERLVTAHADLSPDRRLHSTNGHARALYMELAKSISTRAKPEGGALGSVVEKFVTSAMEEAEKNKLSTDDVIATRLNILSDLVGGYDFASVIRSYWKAHDTGNDELKANAVRWLRGEFSTKTDARIALGVRTIVSDDNFYDQLKLLSKFTRLAGYGGLLVCLDEMVNLYKMANTKARNTNYEQILRILNDCGQGSPAGLGVILGGTPDFLLDARKGLYSYQALQSRLSENQFKSDGMIDFSGPVIRLVGLTKEDLYILLQKLRSIYSSGNSDLPLLSDNDLTAFMAHCSRNIGDSYFKTPRQTVRTFLDLYAILDQNREKALLDLLPSIKIESDPGPSMQSIDDD